MRQAIIAVGPVAFSAKGFSRVPRVAWAFTESHTDFIFAILCEELGFIGGFLVLILFFILIWRCLVIIQQAKDKNGRWLPPGLWRCSSSYPGKYRDEHRNYADYGIPLPFISSGGSSMITNLFAIGFENIWIRRQKLSLMA